MGGDVVPHIPQEANEKPIGPHYAARWSGTHAVPQSSGRRCDRVDEEDTVQPSQTQASGSQQPNKQQSTTQILTMLRDVRDRARQDVDSIQNPKIQALLETTAEVVQGLMKAYEDFEKGNEKAWQ